MGKCRGPIGTIALEIVLRTIEFVKISYWALKEQKNSREAKRALMGSKSENLLYLSKYDYIRPKNWQILRTNWYNCFRKGFMGYSFCKSWLLGTEGAKITS